FRKKQNYGNDSERRSGGVVKKWGENINKVTIKDVSIHANVGVGTVSRAIHNSTEISDETRKKVMESVEELGYKPDELARSMRSKKYRNIVLFADITNPVFAEIAKEAQIEFANHGYTLTLCHIGLAGVKEKIISFLEGRKFDGVILSTPIE